MDDLGEILFHFVTGICEEGLDCSVSQDKEFS